MKSFFFFPLSISVCTHSLCSTVRDVQQDMLKGPSSANRLNTHITHPPSFLISLFVSQIYHSHGAEEQMPPCFMLGNATRNRENFQILKWFMKKYSRGRWFDNKTGEPLWKKKREKKGKVTFCVNPVNLFHSEVGGAGCYHSNSSN